jgi:hypothetical protein
MEFNQWSSANQSLQIKEQEQPIITKRGHSSEEILELS